MSRKSKKYDRDRQEAAALIVAKAQEIVSDYFGNLTPEHREALNRKVQWSDDLWAKKKDDQ